jgi:hypothetical protein
MGVLHLEALEARRWSFDLFSFPFDGDVLPSWSIFIGDLYMWLDHHFLFYVLLVSCWRILFLYSSLG